MGYTNTHLPQKLTRTQTRLKPSAVPRCQGRSP